MKQIKFTVEKTKTGYSAYAEIDGGIAATTGANLTELKNNALESLNGLLTELNKKPVTIEAVKLVYDIPQFFEYYNIINISALAERIGMNRTLLSQYVNNPDKKPSTEQAKRILNGVQQLGRELSTIEFV